MDKNHLHRGSFKGQRRLLHLALVIIFILNSIWTTAFSRSGAEITQKTNMQKIITQRTITKSNSLDWQLSVQESSNIFTELPQEQQSQEQPPQELQPQEQLPQEQPPQEQPQNLLDDQPQSTMERSSNFSVTNLTAAPNSENNAIILTWENPTENFYCVVIQKWNDYGDGSSWEYIGNTEENPEVNTFTDTKVTYYFTYKYRVVAVDNNRNFQENPSDITAKLSSPKSIMLQEWRLDNEGIINSHNIDSYGVDANFIADKDIVSIEYELSVDNTNWAPIDETMFVNDSGLDYNIWSKIWYRSMYLDFTEYEHDNFWIRVTATDTDGVTLSDVKELSRDLTCEDATNFTAVPNAENTAFELSWSVPHDYDYGELYKEYYYYGWKWGYVDKVTGTGYTDTDVNTDNPYITYKYKIIIYDKCGNESQNPPVISANFATSGPISFKEWSLATEGGKINRYYSSDYGILASFYSLKPISTIQYKYSFDGETWLSLTPFISYDDGNKYDQENSYGYHYIKINIGDQSGIPDGDFYIQAVCTDEDGNTYTEENTLIKDATPPQNVSNITALPNEDNTAIILSWKNPESDFSYLKIEKASSYISPPNFNLETFTDSSVKTGQKYTYKFTTCDDFGNPSENPPTIQAVLSTTIPILESMVPENNYITKNTSLPYSATFRSDKRISRVVFEASRDGEVWELLKDAAPTIEYNGYYLSGSWDISSVDEEKWSIRATAYAEDGGTASETRTIMIDHKAPPAPSNFKAEVTSFESPYAISLTWDAVDGADKYNIERHYANPSDGGFTQVTVNSPDNSYIWSTGLYAEKPYIFKIRSVDKAGNISEAVSFEIEIHTGPNIILDRGYDVYTNDSSYVLSGATTPGAVVTINGSTVATDTEGKFSYSSVLTVQNNTFTIKAEQESITHTVKQTVVYDTIAPTISTFTPYDNTLMQGKRAFISISTYDNIYRNIMRQTLQVSKDDGISWIDILEIPYGQTNVFWDTTANVGGDGPLADGAYKFRLMVWDKAGNVTGESLVRIWKIDNTRPESPTKLTAVQEIGKVKLSWLASISPDIKTSYPYKIYRSSVSGGSYSQIDTSNNISYEDINVSDGSTYYYVITVTDIAGNESIYSNETSASPAADNTPPVFKSIPSNGGKYGGPEARFYIVATDNSPKGVDKFIMEYSNDEGASWKSYTLGASSRTIGGAKEYYNNYSLDTTGMVSGDYMFRFYAVDYSGNTTVENRNFTFDLSVDSIQNLTARSGEGAVILEWTIPNNSDISSYDIMRSTYYSGGYYKIKTVYGAATTTYSDTTAELGKTYYYKVISKDSYSNQAVSGIVSAVASDDLTPPQITNINVADSALIGGKEISLIVSATDNKKPVDVKFLGSQDGGITWKTLQTVRTGTYIQPDNVTYNFYYDWYTSGLASGEIIVKVIVNDAAGNEGEMRRTWTLDLYVTPPANLRTTSGDGSILIEWDAITDEDINNYAYDVLRSANPGGPYTTIKAYLSKNTTQYTDTSAQTGITYYYVIRSRDKFGNEALSSEITAAPAEDKISPFIDSISPANGTTIGGDVSQTLRVNASDNAGMKGVTAQIEYSVDGENWLPVSENIGDPIDLGSNKFYFQCRWDLRELSSGDYKVRYTIIDAAGNSSYIISDYSVDRTGPSAPKNLIATYGQKAVGLVWEIVPEADTIGYNIYRANTINGTYKKLLTEGSITISGKDSNIYSDNTVQEGITYFYKVAGVDKYYQEGDMSNIASAAAIPDVFPPTVTLIEPDHHTVIGAVTTITVTAEDNVALSSITLEYNNQNNESDWIAIDTIATLGTAVFEWSTKPLSGNVKVRAIARDSAGNISDGSLYRAYIIDNTGPSVTGLKGTGFGGDIVLEWDSVPDRDLAYFLVEKKDNLGNYKEVKKVYNILGLNIPNLDPTADYWFRVTAFDKMGNPGESAEIMVNSGADLIPPTVRYESYCHNIYSGNVSIVINPFFAKDNVGVKKLITQYSSDEVNWIQISERILEKANKEVRFNETWDVSTLPDGDYYVRVLAEDEAGNMSQPSVAALYTVDHVRPAAPNNLTLNSTAGYIEVMWKYSADKDFSFFKLWRAEREEGPYESVIPNKYVYMGYRDRTVEPGKTYYYKVTVVDAANNESESSEIISGSLTEDKNPPGIYFRNPLEGDILNSKPRFEITFFDDLSLKSMKVEYQQESSDNDSWNLIIAKDYNPDGLSKQTQVNEKFYWDNKGIPEGWYKVRIIVEDSAENITGPLIMRYLVNNIAPEKPILSAEPGGWQVNLSWTSDDQIDDFSIYKLYRTNILGGDGRNIKSTSDKSFTDIGVQPGITYYYYIRAYDIYGNYSQSDTVSVVPTSEDKIPPIADAGDDHILTVGMEAYFDGTLSKDNHRIASYFWNFGDGSTAVTSHPTHSYSEAGNYTLTLMVTDPAGNTSTDTTSVKVVSIDEVGILEVKVIDDVTGELLPGSSVVIDYPDGATHKTTTNSVGAAFVVAPPGEYEVFAFKTDFRPASVKVTMARGQKNTVMIRLPKGSVVTGELKAERMNLDEIIAAGIDITDPANQNVYKFEIGLGFNIPDIPIIVTKQRFIRPPNAPLFYTVSDDGNKITIRERQGENDGSGSGRIFYGEKLNLPESAPAMAYMVIPGKTTWLKEFFDIGFTIQNAADPEYIIEDAWARLTIPDGLSLAPTRETQHEYIEMGSIPGGQSKSVNWIIRGDKKGEYRLEAEFNGILMPFEDGIKQIFRNDEPFRVWAGDALIMHIITQDRADKGYPYDLRLGLENISDITLYNISLELLEETKTNYIYAPNQELTKTVAELKPGETLWGDYKLISAIDGLLSLGQSYNLKTGGNTDIEEKMVSISVLENSPSNAPVLKQENKDDNTVKLSWDQVEGALGYKIYRIREDLFISQDPEELVYSCGPEELSAVLPEPYGAKDYIITTLVAEGDSTKEVLLHAITGLSWIDDAAKPTITIDPEILIIGRETELLVTAKKGGKPLQLYIPGNPPSIINGTIDVGELVKGKVLDDNGQAKVVVKPMRAGPIEVKSYLMGELITQKTINAVFPKEPKQPKGLKAVKGDRKATLTWFPNSETEVEGYYVYQIKDNSWSKINSGILKSENFEDLISYEVTDLNDNTTYTFQVSAVDFWNRESVPSEPAQVTLTIPKDIIAPWVVRSSPVNQAGNVSLDTTIIQVFFSENIALNWDEASGKDNIRVKVGKQYMDFVPETSAGSNILTITLTEELPMKTQCKVKIPKGFVRDKYFNELENDYLLEFFTEAEEDDISPVLVAISPKENAQLVTVHSTIFLYFSEEINAGRAYDNILITANGIPVPHSKAINGTKIIIKPLNKPPHMGVLPYNSKIEIYIPEGAVIDSAGNSSEVQYSLKFYTGGK